MKDHLFAWGPTSANNKLIGRELVLDATTVVKSSLTKRNLMNTQKNIKLTKEYQPHTAKTVQNAKNTKNHNMTLKIINTMTEVFQMNDILYYQYSEL